MYGTRDAAQNWEVAYCQFMAESGFTSGKATPCTFHNRGRNIRVVVHGDDFTILGAERDLDWFRSQIQTRFEVKFRGRIGPDVGDDKSIRILNAIVTWTKEGIEYEADQRHAEIIVQQMGLERDSRKVNTPGVKQETSTEGEMWQRGTLKTPGWHTPKRAKVLTWCSAARLMRPRRHSCPRLFPLSMRAQARRRHCCRNRHHSHVLLLSNS